MKKLILISLLSLFVQPLLPQTEQIESLQKQREILQEEITITNRLYLDIKKQAGTILDRINLIHKQISSRRELVNVRRAEIDALKSEEHRLAGEIDKLNRDLKIRQNHYANAIKGMLNQKHNQNKLLFILSGKSFGESLRRMQYLKEYSKRLKVEAEEIKKKNVEITLKKEALSKAKDEKEKALLSLQAEQKKLESEEKTGQSEVSKARGQEQQLKKRLVEKQHQANQLNAEIERLIAEEVVRQEAEELKQRSEAAKRGEKIEELAEKPADKKKGVVPPVVDLDRSTHSTETFNLSKDFASNRGKLPMPITGSSTIVGNFGTKKHNEWNVTTNSNGIDIQSEAGADIRSVFDGEVSKVFSFPGSNSCVIVRHGDYYTFYANIYDLFVKQGDKVKTGQPMGRVFTDPDTGISTMHFQLWQKTNKLNPAPWLKR